MASLTVMYIFKEGTFFLEVSISAKIVNMAEITMSLIAPS